MKKFKPAAALAAAAIVALTVSGCYAFSGLTTSKTKLVPGKSSTINVKSYSRTGTQDRDVFFLLIGLPDNSTGDTGDDPLKAINGKFDTGGVLYNNPKPLGPSTAIRDELVNSGNCGELELTDVPTERFVVLATANRVKQTRPSRQVNAQYVLKQIRLNEDINPLALMTAVGFWDDDGDDIPESGVFGELGCGGGALHNINAKQPPEAPRTTKRDLLERYAK